MSPSGEYPPLAVSHTQSVSNQTFKSNVFCLVKVVTLVNKSLFIRQSSSLPKLIKYVIQDICLSFSRKDSELGM